MQTLKLEKFFETPATIPAIPFYITESDKNGFVHVYVFDHISLTNGYVRKKATCKPVPYDGNFGRGYTVKLYNPNSTRYALKAYYVEVSHKSVCIANDNCTLCPLYSVENVEEYNYKEGVRL